MRTARRGSLVAVLVLAATALIAACGDDDGGEAATTTAGGVDGEVVVLAAASLTDAFTEIGEAFEAANPGADVTFSFAASSQLATQLAEGAPADVFASADEANMQRAVDAGVIDGEPVVFARNVLEVVVPAGDTSGITALEDLYRPGLRLALCAPEVPCGRYAVEAFEKAGLGPPPPASQEENVRGVLTKVSQGEADAGIVYRTDVLAGGSAVEGVEIPVDVNVEATYPIALVSDAPNADGGDAFIDYVRSPEGITILEEYGFLAP